MSNIYYNTKTKFLWLTFTYLVNRRGISGESLITMKNSNEHIQGTLINKKLIVALNDTHDTFLCTWQPWLDQISS